MESKHKEEFLLRYVFQRRGKVKVLEEGGEKGNETEKRREEDEVEDKENKEDAMVEDKGKEADVREEPNKGEEDNNMVKDKEHVDEGEVNKVGGQSLLMAFNEKEMKKDTQCAPHRHK